MPHGPPVGTDQVVLAQWWVAVFLGLVSLAIIVTNWALLVAHLGEALHLVTKKKRSSLGPLGGGLVGMVAMLLCPARAVQERAWLPLVVDPGCALYLTYFFVFGGIVLPLRKRRQDRARKGAPDD